MLSRYQNDSHEKFGGFLMFTVAGQLPGVSRFNEILKMLLGSNVIGQKTKMYRPFHQKTWRYQHQEWDDPA